MCRLSFQQSVGHLHTTKFNFWVRKQLLYFVISCAQLAKLFSARPGMVICHTAVTPIYIALQAFIPGGCFSDKKKYCPIQLDECSNENNYGYNWTVQVQSFCRLEGWNASSYLAGVFFPARVRND